jgi:hypothetical protein
MQGTTDFHHPIADARLAGAVGVVDDMTAFDAAVDMLDAYATAGDIPICGALARMSARPCSFWVGLMTSTWSSVNAIHTMAIP